MDPEEIESELESELEAADMDSVGKFMKMFDRMLLYTLAVNFLPEEAIRGTVDLWDTVIKKNINDDSVNRTEFLESTKPGRLALYKNEPDGEDVRMHFLQQWKTARKVIVANLSKERAQRPPFDLDDDIFS